MGRLRVRLLGDLRAYREGGADSAAAGRKAQALLAYLALNPKQRCTRDRLASLLWSDRGEEQARHSLRQTVLALRKALDDEGATILVTDGDRLALNPETTEVDVRSFERLAAANTREALEQARALYQGDLLEGIDVRSEDFDEWLAAERARLRDLVADVLQRLAQIYMETGDWNAALGSAQQLLSLDPSREEGHRTLMRLYDRTGRRSLALRQFRTCEEILKRELDVAPSPETVRLDSEIRARSGETGAAEGTPATDVSPNRGSGQSAASSPSVGPLFLHATKAAPLEWVRRRVSPRALAVAAAMVMTLGAVGVIEFGGFATPERADPAKMAFPLPEKPSIAVLPFENLSGDRAQDSLGAALASDITTTLSIISEMFVIDRNSTLGYLGKAVKARDAAEELGVRYVLEGNIQKSGDRVRISVELVDALAGHNLWADRYDREVTDIFALLDEITLAIVTALQVRMTEGEQERISLVHGTQNLQAWVLAGQGLQLLRRLTQEDNARARELYQQAVALDPNYPGAWDGLAWSRLIDARFGWSGSPETNLKIAAGLAQKMLTLDPTRGRTYSLLGAISLMAADHVQAVTYGEKAMALDPNGAEIAALFGLTLTYTGDAERAISLVTKAMRLSPYYPEWYRWALGRAYRLAGRYKEAEKVLTAPASGPESVLHLVELTATYSEMGRLPEARAASAEVLKINPGFSVLAWTKAPPYRGAAMTRREIEILHRAGLPD